MRDDIQIDVTDGGDLLVVIESDGVALTHRDPGCASMRDEQWAIG